MWIEVKKAPNLMLAEMWKELFEGEGVPAQILPEPNQTVSGELAKYRVLIPRSREHIIQEVLRKI